MSVVLIAVLLIVPIVVVIIFLNIDRKKQKQKAAKKSATYLHLILRQTGIINSYQKQISHQLVILDEVNHRLLVIDHVNNTYSHCIYDLDYIKSIEVTTVQQVIPNNENYKGSERFTSQIGLELIYNNGAYSRQLLVFYDHLKHSIYLMSEKEKEAKRLRERLQEAGANKRMAT